MLAEMHASGTTTVEVKSGYGLDTATEERSVRLAAQFADEVTFMGAHVVAPEFAGRADDYVDLVCGEMLQACAPHAGWIDAFCDTGAFTTEQGRRILQAGVAAGLKPRVHLCQLERGDGVALAVETDCASADHLTYLDDSDIELLAGSNTVAGLVPAADFSTRAPQYPRARDLIDAGATVALSPDCNPGSSFTTSMPFTVALAVREMRMTCEEALLAATVGGAAALRRGDVGHLREGARGDFVVLDAPSYVHLAYRPGVHLTSSTWKQGTALYRKEGAL
jgi:imidazolonepropionase